MAKCHYVGIVSGKYRWIVCGNGADVSITAGWFYDGNLKRYVQAKSITTGTDTEGNAYIDIAVNDGYVTSCYDYIHPYKVRTAGGSPDWTNTSNAIDDSVSTYSELEFDLDLGGTRTLYLAFANTNNNTINEKRLYYYCAQNNALGFTLTGFTTPASIDVSGGDGNTVVTGTPTEIGFNLTDDTTNIGYGRVHKAYLRLEYEMTELNDLFAVVQNTNNTQREIIADICDEVGISYIDNTDVTAIDLDFVMDEQKPAIEHIKQIAIAGACVPYVNSNNQLKLLKVDLSATSNKELQVKDIESVSLSKSSLENIVNDMEISYGFDNYTGGNTQIASDSNTTSQTINGVRSKSIDSKYYKDTPTGLLDYHVDGTSETFFSELRNIATIKTNSILGVLPYDNSGNFKPLFALEIGDVISVNANYDDIEKCNGESWSGKKLLIYGIELGVGYMQYKVVEL